MTTLALPPPAELNPARKAPPFGAAARRTLSRLIVLTLAVVLTLYAFRLGTDLRAWLWTYTAPIRFTGDVSNGWNWGKRVRVEALKVERARGSDTHVPDLSAMLAGWQEVIVSQTEIPGDRLDYPPLRLLAVSMWVRAVRADKPDQRGWQDDVTAPMLEGNTVAAALAALAAFLLVHHWVRLNHCEPDPLAPRPVLAGLAAAGLLWFNLAVLIDGHAWPQWDGWIIPAYLWAAYFVSTDRGLLAGASLAVGAMLKGQILLAAPIFLLWPLFEGRWSTALRVAAGFILTAGLIVWPFLIRTGLAETAVVTAILAAVLILPARRLRRIPKRLSILATLCLIGLAAWPYLADLSRLGTAIMLSAGVAAAAWLLPATRDRTAAALLLVGLAIFLGGTRFGGSWAWYTVGYARGADQYREMSVSASNLPALMAARWGWRINTPFHIGWGPVGAWWSVHAVYRTRSVLRVAYFLTLGLCAYAAARQSRRGDARLLVAIAAPWVLLVALMPQMHERYLLWGAAVTALFAGVGVGFTLLHLAITAIAASFMLASMTNADPNWWPELTRLSHGLQPDVGWAVVLAAGVLLAAAFGRSRMDAGRFSPARA